MTAEELSVVVGAAATIWAAFWVAVTLLAKVDDHLSRRRYRRRRNERAKEAK